MRRGKRKREKWVPHVLNLLGDNGWEEKGTSASCQKAMGNKHHTIRKSPPLQLLQYMMSKPGGCQFT